VDQVVVVVLEIGKEWHWDYYFFDETQMSSFEIDRLTNYFDYHTTTT
jgi:hypothetical protein